MSNLSKTIFEKTAMQYYEEEFNKVLELRKQRAKVYGDDWIDSPLDPKIWFLWEKASRATYILKNGKNDYEDIKDTLYDSINYALFALAKLKKEEDMKVIK